MNPGHKRAPTRGYVQVGQNMPAGILLPVPAFGTPQSLPGLQLWLDASQPSTLPGAVNNNDPVSQWNDLSGFGLNVVQATGLNQPLLQTAVQNGKSGILFSGASSVDLGLASGIGSLQTAAKTFFVLAKPAVTPAATKPFFNLNSNNYYLGQTNAAGKIIISWFNGVPAQKTATGTTSTFTTTNAHVVSVRFTINSGNPTIEAWIDGANTISSVNADGIGSTYGTKLLVGGYETATTFWNGTIHEVIFYNRALSDYERKQVESYLRLKWSTP